MLKNLERSWRAMWIRIVVRLMRAAPRAGPAPWTPGATRILFLRHDRLGDMILTTAALHAIATSRPGVRLDVLASPLNAPVLHGSDEIGRVILFDKRKPWTYPVVAWRLRRARYDAVVDCMVTAPSLTTLLLMLASGAPQRIAAAGRAGRGRTDDAITVAVPTPDVALHMTERLGALSAAFGVDVARTDWRPRIVLDAREREHAKESWASATGTGKRWLVNISAGIVQRRWPAERYVEVLRHLRGRDAEARIIVISAPDERERADEIATAAAADARVVHTSSIRAAFALVATADFVFTPDTSIAHAASAFGTPAVAMYLRGYSERWGLYRLPSRNLESDGPTLDALDAQTVITAIDEVLAMEPVATPGNSTG